jgi:hypothetical protein
MKEIMRDIFHEACCPAICRHVVCVNASVSVAVEMEVPWDILASTLTSRGQRANAGLLRHRASC